MVLRNASGSSTCPVGLVFELVSPRALVFAKVSRNCARAGAGRRPVHMRDHVVGDGSARRRDRAKPHNPPTATSVCELAGGSWLAAAGLGCTSGKLWFVFPVSQSRIAMRCKLASGTHARLFAKTSSIAPGVLGGWWWQARVDILVTYGRRFRPPPLGAIRPFVLLSIPHAPLHVHPPRLTLLVIPTNRSVFVGIFTATIHSLVLPWSGSVFSY